MRTRLLGLLAFVLAILLVAAWIHLRPEPPLDWGDFKRQPANLDDRVKIPTFPQPPTRRD